VSRYSTHKDEAIAFVRYFTGYRQQLRRWKSQTNFPTIRAVYRDPELQAWTPLGERARDAILRGIFDRPSAFAGKNYDQLSSMYFIAAHSVLTHRMSARQALSSLDRDLAQLPGLRLPEQK
jgi:trehalose/maltose transport system substrate-binding protein